jgi:hypothetical protein
MPSSTAGLDRKPLNELTQADLALMRREKIHPLCRCQEPPLEMSIAKVGKGYIIKCMRDTAIYHAPGCQSGHVPSSLSGIAELEESGAITIDPETERIELKLGFKMSTKTSKKADPGGMSTTGGGAKSDNSPLKITYLLHYLWHIAGLDEWTPKTGTRNWDSIRENLVEAAESIDVRTSSLSELIFMPESSQDEISQLRQIERISYIKDNSQQMGILIGRMGKRFLPSVSKQNSLEIHGSRIRLTLDDKIYNKMMNKYPAELELWKTDEDTELIVIATFSTILDSYGFPSHSMIHELALMPTTATWIPYTKPHQLEKDLIEKLRSDKRHFAKCFRYNLSPAKPFPSVVLRDAIAPEIDMFVCPEEAVSTVGSPFQDILDKKPETTWCWFAGSNPEMLADMPPIPQKQAQRKGK